MNVLFIVADDILVNFSASLCHLSYIKGCVEAGYHVDLLCASNRGVEDPSLTIPDSVGLTRYNGKSVYEVISKARESVDKVNEPSVDTEYVGKVIQHKETVFSILKKTLRSIYGVYSFYKAFVWRASRYRSKTEYDYTVSLSFPPASHLLAYRLIRNKRVNTKHWIQIWEDPWASDLYANATAEIYEEERKLLSYAEKVVYVTPLTLNNQKRLYPEYAHKMTWCPLPSYYKNSEGQKCDFSKHVFGYFGDYYSFSRNLRPFYEAAVNTETETYICGNPDNMFVGTEYVNILPRMPLSQLREYESKVNVLVFVCNLTGGQIPGKIYQYSATNKKILFILDGTEEEKRVLKDYFSQFNRYYFCENSVESITAMIQQINSGTNTNIVNEPLEYFEPRNIVAKIIEKVT